jgi:hypothetical protein
MTIIDGSNVISGESILCRPTTSKANLTTGIEHLCTVDISALLIIVEDEPVFAVPDFEETKNAGMSKRKGVHVW